MESPSKRQKTSTPIGVRAPGNNSDISSMDIPSDCSDVANLESLHEEDELSSLKSCEENHISVWCEDFNQYFEGWTRPAKRGSSWKLIRPLREDSLYAKIVEEPFDGEATATSLLEIYQRNPQVAVFNLVQLIADISGFQRFDVTKMYQGNPDVLVQNMEKDTTVKNSLWQLYIPLAESVKMGIYSFFHNLIIQAHESGILYDNLFSTHLHTCLRSFACCKNYLATSTGTILSAKIMTSMTVVFEELVQSEKSKTSQLKTINKYIEFLNIIFKVTMFYSDQRWVHVQVAVIQEMHKWVVNDPEFFICKHEYLRTYIVRFIKDMYSKVRLSALEFCKKILFVQTIEIYLEKYIGDMMKEISERLLDVDIPVAVKAVEILQKCRITKPAIFPSKDMGIIISFLFNKHPPLASAAGSFLVMLTKKQEETPINVILKLSELINIPGYEDYSSVLVQGCLPHCEYFKYWDKIVLYLLQTNDSIERRKVFIEITHASVHQVLTDVPLHLVNEKDPPVIVNIEENNKISDAFLTNLKKLFTMYEAYPKILIEILEIVALLNIRPKDLNLLTSVCEVYMETFFSHYARNKQVLESIVKVLSSFYNNNDYQRRAYGFITYLAKKYFKKLTDTLMDSKPDDSALEELCLQVSVLLPSFNLIDLLDWDIIYMLDFDGVELINKPYASNALNICKSHLIWSARDLINSVNEINDVEQLSNEVEKERKRTNAFIITCCNIINNRNAPLELKHKAFEYMVYLYKQYHILIDGVISTHKSRPVINKLSRDLQHVVVLPVIEDFMSRCVIENKKLELNLKQKYVVMCLELILLNAVDGKCFAVILRYYASHYNEYGEHIDYVLSQFQSLDVNGLIVLYGLIDFYEKVKQKTSDIASNLYDAEEMRGLRELAVQLNQSKHFRVNNIFLTQMIQYAMSAENNLSFLHIVKYFLKDCDDTAKSSLKTIVKRVAVEKGFQKNFVVIYFCNQILNPAKKSSTKKKSTKKTDENTTPGKSTSGKKTKKIPSIESNETSITAPHQSSKRRGAKKQLIYPDPKSNSDTDFSEELTIHDSESDT